MQRMLAAISEAGFANQYREGAPDLAKIIREIRARDQFGKQQTTLVTEQPITFLTGTLDASPVPSPPATTGDDALASSNGPAVLPAPAASPVIVAENTLSGIVVGYGASPKEQTHWRVLPDSVAPTISRPIPSVPSTSTSLRRSRVAAMLARLASRVRSRSTSSFASRLSLPCIDRGLVIATLGIATLVGVLFAIIVHITSEPAIPPGDQEVRPGGVVLDALEWHRSRALSTSQPAQPLRASPSTASKGPTAVGDILLFGTRR
jgi:hypothetical protein